MKAGAINVGSIRSGRRRGRAAGVGRAAGAAWLGTDTAGSAWFTDTEGSFSLSDGRPRRPYIFAACWANACGLIFRENSFSNSEFHVSVWEVGMYCDHERNESLGLDASDSWNSM